MPPATSITFAALRARFEADRAASAGGSTDYAGLRLARALRSIGWSGTDLMDAEDVADYLIDVFDACVSDHHDLSVLHRNVADLLRNSGPLLDGSLPPAAAYLPAAEDVVRRYVLDTE